MQDYDVKEKDVLKKEDTQEDVFGLRELFESEEERELRLTEDIKKMHRIIKLKNKEIDNLNETISNLDEEKSVLDEELFELKKSRIQAKRENNLEEVQKIEDKIRTIEAKIELNTEEIELYEVQSVLFKEKVDVLRTNLDETVSNLKRNVGRYGEEKRERIHQMLQTEIIKSKYVELAKKEIKEEDEAIEREKENNQDEIGDEESRYDNEIEGMFEGEDGDSNKTVSKLEKRSEYKKRNTKYSKKHVEKWKNDEFEAEKEFKEEDFTKGMVQQKTPEFKNMFEGKSKDKENYELMAEDNEDELENESVENKDKKQNKELTKEEKEFNEKKLKHQASYDKLFDIFSSNEKMRDNLKTWYENNKVLDGYSIVNLLKAYEGLRKIGSLLVTEENLKECNLNDLVRFTRYYYQDVKKSGPDDSELSNFQVEEHNLKRMKTEDMEMAELKQKVEDHSDLFTSVNEHYMHLDMAYSIEEAKSELKEILNPSSDAYIGNIIKLGNVVKETFGIRSLFSDERDVFQKEIKDVIKTYGKNFESTLAHYEEMIYNMSQGRGDMLWENEWKRIVRHYDIISIEESEKPVKELFDNVKTRNRVFDFFMCEQKYNYLASIRDTIDKFFSSVQYETEIKADRIDSKVAGEFTYLVDLKELIHKALRPIELQQNKLDVKIIENNQEKTKEKLNKGYKNDKEEENVSCSPEKIAQERKNLAVLIKLCEGTKVELGLRDMADELERSKFGPNRGSIENLDVSEYNKEIAQLCSNLEESSLHGCKSVEEIKIQLSKNNKYRSLLDDSDINNIFRKLKNFDENTSMKEMLKKLGDRASGKTAAAKKTKTKKEKDKKSK